MFRANTKQYILIQGAHQTLPFLLTVNLCDPSIVWNCGLSDLLEVIRLASKILFRPVTMATSFDLEFR